MATYHAKKEACRLETVIQGQPVFFESNIKISLNPEALDILNLVPSLAKNKPIRITSADPDFQINVSKAIQTISQWHFKGRRAWIPDYTKERDSESEIARNLSGTATFFSGGADSFYTLLRHQYKIDSLIFVHGFDISLNNQAVIQSASMSVEEVATSLGKQLVHVRTNIRELLDQHISWGSCGHGIAMAVVAHLLAPHFSQIFIPSSYHFSQLFPWGTHPKLDPLWSSRAVRLIHDGCDAYREDKFAYIAQNELVLQHLRICFDEKAEQFNCNRCRKCLNAKLHLMEHGKLSHAQTLTHNVRARDLLRTDMYNILSSKYNLRYLWAKPEHRKLALAMGLSYYRGKATHESVQILRKLKAILSG